MTELPEKLKNLIWSEKYRPKNLDECIIPEDIRETFKGFVSKGNIPPLLVSGGPGTGKSSIVLALLKTLDADFIDINGSLNGNIDTLRNEIKDFASSVSLFKKGRKYVVISEADYLTQPAQAGLRAFIEEYHQNCGFIFTCNYKHRLIEPLHSRFTNIDFDFTPKVLDKLKIQFFKRLISILDGENVSYDKNVLVELIRKHFPDMRRILNECERYSSNGKIDTGILVSELDDNFELLVTILKEKKYTEMRKWVSENSHIDINVLIRKIYDKSVALLKPNNVPAISLLCGKYMYESAFIADPEICSSCFLTEVMVDSEWL